jgi:hypothetical protein
MSHNVSRNIIKLSFVRRYCLKGKKSKFSPVMSFFPKKLPHIRRIFEASAKLAEKNILSALVMPRTMRLRRKRAEFSWVFSSHMLPHLPSL